MGKQKQKQRRIKQDEIQKRILSLEALYGQRGLAKKLNVSVDTIRRYRTGKSNPNPNAYKKINQVFGQNKKKIQTDIIQTKIKKIQKRTETYKTGKPKNRCIIIYPDYMYNSPAREFEGVENFYFLEELQEKGYVAGYFGTKEIPTEVQFVIDGENLHRFGKILNLVGIISKEVSPKAGNAYTGNEASLEVFPVYIRLVKGFKKDTDFLKRMDLAREFFFENINVERGFPIAFLGFYFKEGDEL